MDVCAGLIATDWTYLSEGGAHIVILCKNTENVCFGSVLRIPKVKRMDNDQSSNLHLHFMNGAFVKNSMKRWFQAEHLVDSQLISLPAEFIAEVLSSVETMRYEGRIDSEMSLLPFGYLESNLLQIDNSNLSKSFSFEFKVKCGLSSCSPLLHPLCQAKLKYHRFEIMQQYKLHKKKIMLNQMPWGIFTTLSKYNPRDLCSRVSHRVREAVHTLFLNPQNNLGIKYNNQHIFGWNEKDSFKLVDAMKDSLSDYFPKEQEILNKDITSDPTLATLLLELYKTIITNLCIQSPLLHKLEMLQVLDILDTEGMERVYKRGIHLSNQSLSVFELSLLTYIAHHQLHMEEIHALGSFLLEQISDGTLSTFDWSCQCSNFTPKVMELVNLRVRLTHDISERTMRRDKAIAVIEQLELQEVFYLLYIQMLSMITKDCSLIVTLRPVLIPASTGDDTTSLQEILNQYTPSSQMEIEFPIIVHPAVDAPCSSPKTSSSIGCIYPFGKDHPLSFQFHMKWIDIGLKPLSKLHHKHEKEKQICQILFGELHE